MTQATLFDHIKIKEMPFQIIDGDRGANYPKGHEFSNNGFCLFLSTKNVTKDGFDFSQNQFITTAKDNQLKKGKLQRFDVILTTRGTVGNVSLYDNTVQYSNVRINSGMVILRCDRTKLLPKYLYFILKSELFQNQVANFSSGSAQPQLPIRDMQNMKLPLPNLEKQQYIIDQIGTLDEKIGLNRRMNETLEKMGQALFRYYFIDNPEASSWENGNFGRLAEINARSIDKDYEHENILYVDISSVSTSSIEKVEPIKLVDAPTRARRIVRGGDIIWAMVRPNRRAYSLVMDPPKNLVVSTGFAVISPKEYALGYCYYYASSQAFSDYLTLHARGAAYPAVTATDFKNAPIAIPNLHNLKMFNELVLPNMLLLNELKQEIKSLTAFRDSLLSRLINGKIKV